MQPNHNATFEVVGAVRFAQVPKWVIRHPRLSVGAKALYADIMTYADNGTRSAFPSRERMASDLNVSVSTIGRYIKELESADVIAVSRRRNKRTGNFYANHYRLAWSEPQVTSDTRREFTSDTVTKPTVLTTPTSPDASDLPIAAVHPLPPIDTIGAHSVQEQLGISKESKDKLIDRAIYLYSEGINYWDDDVWDDFADEIEAVTGAEVGDLIANKRFDERLAEVIEQHSDRGPRYGASAWLGTLINTSQAAGYCCVT